jgi:ankyrin repeat protein
MAAWLIEHGANPNPRYEGKSPYTMTKENGQPELTALLQSHGGLEESYLAVYV